MGLLLSKTAAIPAAADSVPIELDEIHKKLGRFLLAGLTPPGYKYATAAVGESL
jgi:hypothetical protein